MQGAADQAAADGLISLLFSRCRHVQHSTRPPLPGSRGLHGQKVSPLGGASSSLARASCSAGARQRELIPWARLYANKGEHPGSGPLPSSPRSLTQ
jgi:hypothetical protein